jgi:hypothetical protein
LTGPQKVVLHNHVGDANQGRVVIRVGTRL